MIGSDHPSLTLQHFGRFSEVDVVLAQQPSTHVVLDLFYLVLHLL